MFIKFFESLRFRLVLLVLLAVLPALGLTLYSGLQDRRRAYTEARNTSLELARQAARHEERLIRDARTILSTLSQLPQVQELEIKACSKIFADLLKQAPYYTGLAVIGSDGGLLAGVPAADPTIRFADRPWFRRLVQTKDFVVGQYQIGRISGRPTMVLAHPVLDYEGRFQAVLTAGLNLDWLNNFIREVDLPQNISLTLVDRNGTVLARHPEGAQMAGRAFPESKIFKFMARQKEGTAESNDFDHLPRLFGFTFLGSGNGDVFIMVGVPRREAFAQADRKLVRHLVWLGLAAALALLAAWLVGNLFILRPVRKLLQGTKRLAHGDLDFRAGPPYEAGELGRLAEAFDQMAESLQRRVLETKLAEQQLEGNKRLLETVLDAIPDVIGLQDTDYRILSYNAAGYKLLGLSLEEVYGKRCYELLGRAVPCEPCATSQVYRTMRPAHVERYEEALGLWLGVSSYPILDDSGELVYIVEHLRDITERKKSEVEIASAKARLEHLLTANPSVIYTREPEEDFRIVFISGNVEAQTGYLPPAFLENPQFWADHLHPDDSARIKTELAQVLERERGVMEYRFLHQKDYYIWVRDELILVRDMAGRLVEIVGCWTDITDRLEAEKLAIRQSAVVRAINQVFADSLTLESLEEVAAASLDVVVKLTGSKFGWIGLLNQAGRMDILAMSGVDWTSSGGSDAEKPKLIKDMAVRGLWGQVIRQETSLMTNDPISHPDNAGVTEGHPSLTSFLGVPLKHGDQTIGLIALANKESGYDLSDVEDMEDLAQALVVAVDKKSADKKLKEYQTHLEEIVEERTRELERSNAELEQFAYVASHDLQEPLRIMTSYLQLLEKRYKNRLEAEADKFIGNAVGAAARMRTLINDLLAFSRVGTRGQTLAHTDCEAVFQQVLDNLKIAMESAGAVVTNDPLPKVQADAGQLGQLFQNLISNAIKFHGQDSPRVHVSAKKAEGAWTFAVSDNGIGIEPQYTEQIFRVFQRLHSMSKYSGTGIGLAICKKIVERHGGRIWVESTPGQGATFYFTIPNQGGSAE